MAWSVWSTSEYGRERARPQNAYRGGTRVSNSEALSQVDWDLQPGHGAFLGGHGAVIHISDRQGSTRVLRAGIG